MNLILGRNNVLLNLLVIRAKDPSRLVKFYQALGMRFSKERHGNGPEHYACKIDNAVFEIYPSVSELDHTRGTRLGLVVDSIPEVFSAMEKSCIPVNSKIVNSKDRRKAILEDPEGHKVELLEKGPALRVSSTVPDGFDKPDTFGRQVLEPQP
jgi:lactoylglutathione lyase